VKKILYLFILLFSLQAEAQVTPDTPKVSVVDTLKKDLLTIPILYRICEAKLLL